MFILGVSRRVEGKFKPEGQNNEIPYDFVKLHVRYVWGVDADAAQMDAGDSVDIIKVPFAVWKHFLDSAAFKVLDTVGLEISLLYNKWGKVSGISVV